MTICFADLLAFDTKSYPVFCKTLSFQDAFILLAKGDLNLPSNKTATGI